MAIYIHTARNFAFFFRSSKVQALAEEKFSPDSKGKRKSVLKKSGLRFKREINQVRTSHYYLHSAKWQITRLQQQRHVRCQFASFLERFHFPICPMVQQKKRSLLQLDPRCFVLFLEILTTTIELL